MSQSHNTLNVPPTNGHTRSHSLASVLSMSPKKKDKGGITSSIQRPKAITPSIVEKRFGSALGTRTASLPQFRELGPPDLVHIAKYNFQTKKEEAEYHYTTGIDVSSSAALMAYLAIINLNQHSATFKHPTCFTYCAFNAFDRSDVRIRSEFPSSTPGSYELQLLPSDRRKKTLMEVSEEVWEELYVSGVVRSVIFGIDTQRKLPGLIEKTLLQNVSQAKHAISSIIKFLDRGIQLGASEAASKPSLYENYLVDALFIIAEITGLYSHAIETLKNTNREDYNLFVVKLLFASDNEIEAVRYLHRALQKNTRDCLLLNEQTEFLICKGDKNLSMSTALAAVKASPLNSDAWYNLTKCHILNGDLNAALISLNSMPMYGIRQKDRCYPDEKDFIQIPEPAEGKVKTVWDHAIQVWGRESDTMIPFTAIHELRAVDPALVRISRQLMKGTHARAYDLLIIMINTMGWDGLLKARSQVFLMDEEFKNMSTASLHSDLKWGNVKQKRQCERWLDDLFLVLYEDLRVVMIVENELQGQNQLKHSALEWELIGLAGFRTHHFKNCVASLRTANSASFDIIACKKLLHLWEIRYNSRGSKIWNALNKNGEIDMTLDVILRILLQVISYNVRFYNEFSLDVIIFLKRFLGVYDSEFIKNKIQVLFENDNDDFHNSGVIPPFDKLVDLLHTFSPYL